MNGRILIFDIWGDYAHFKKPYTTTSPLSYSIPSRTIVTGIVGAILGNEKNKNNEMLNYKNANIALKIINSVKKSTLNQNLINTKVANSIFRMRKGSSPRTQIKVEYLKNVKYRVYIDIFNDEVYQKLKYNLENHLSYYTCSLGLSENLANFNYLGEYKYSKKTGNIQIESVINLEQIDTKDIVIDIKKEYFTDRFPLEMNEEREVMKYGDILFERNGESISVENIEYIEIENGENILWY